MATPRQHRQIARVRRDFEAASARLASLAAGSDQRAWTRRPAPDAWSAAECIAHLNLTAEAYVPRLEAALLEARGHSPSRGRYRLGVLGAVMVALVGPLPRIAGRRRGRVKAPPAFVPGGDARPDELTSAFERLQARQLELLAEGEGLALDRVKVQSAFVERVSFNLYATFRVLARHQHRHLQQAEDALARS